MASSASALTRCPWTSTWNGMCSLPQESHLPTRKVDTRFASALQKVLSTELHMSQWVLDHTHSQTWLSICCQLHTCKGSWLYLSLVECYCAGKICPENDRKTDRQTPAKALKNHLCFSFRCSRCLQERAHNSMPTCSWLPAHFYTHESGMLRHTEHYIIQTVELCLCVCLCVISQCDAYTT